jgi:iron complex outermembrane recepter protein
MVPTYHGNSIQTWLRRCVAALLAMFLAATINQTVAQDQQSAPPPGSASATKDKSDDLENLLNLPIEQLAKTEVTSSASTQTLQSEVTSASRTSEPIARTPAAIYVVTNEMIRRSGARNIPEVLRNVPGVDVARINASTWAISIRGFNSRFANKLLVQIDGVAIYSPLHSGVFWEREPVMLEDVERIEVIRGPGGAMWGNNAVNGIINIITKSSKDTQGAYMDVGGGNAHRQFSDARFGGRSGDITYRVWGSNMNDNCGVVPSGTPGTADDYYNYGQGGFRADWTPTQDDTITFEGDFVSGLSSWEGVSESMPGQGAMKSSPTKFQKQTLMTRWAHKIDDDTDWAFQGYYYDPYGVSSESNEILESNANYDFDFQYHFNRGIHDVVCGCGYRNDREELTFGMGSQTSTATTLAQPGPVFNQNLDNEKIPSYFFQDTITLVDDRLFATFGSKFDNNNVTNFEYQPTAKLAFTPDDKTSIWGAITRAVRTPSLLERSRTSDLKSEDLLSYEVGYRNATTDKYYWEIAVFYNVYNNLIMQSGAPGGGEQNAGDADTYGFEYNATYQVSETWRLGGSYSFFIETLYVPPGFSTETSAGANPRNQFRLQSGWDLGRNVTFDIMFRYVDSLAIGVEKYFVGDVRLAWRPTRRLEVAVVGQNLFDRRHYEFTDSMGARATEVEQGVYGMVSWRY